MDLRDGVGAQVLNIYCTVAHLLCGIYTNNKSSGATTNTDTLLPAVLFNKSNVIGAYAREEPERAPVPIPRSSLGPLCPFTTFHNIHI